MTIVNIERRQVEMKRKMKKKKNYTLNPIKLHFDYYYYVFLCFSI